MLFLTQKKLQARIDQALALVPQPEPAKDWGPELAALRAEIATLKAERGDIDSLSATVAALVNRPAPVTLEPVVLPEPVDLMPLEWRINELSNAVDAKAQESAKAIGEVSDLATYLLESPTVIREITSVADPSTSVLAAFHQGHWVRPMGQ